MRWWGKIEWLADAFSFSELLQGHNTLDRFMPMKLKKWKRINVNCVCGGYMDLQ